MFLHPLGLLALGAVPLVVALHLFRRRFRPHRVSAIFLWAARDRVPLAGRRREPLRASASFWCETIAALLLALAFAGPRILGAGEAIHLVVVLDGSASMGARSGKESVAERARALVRNRVEALPSGSRVTVIESGSRAAILAGPAAFPTEALEHLGGWEPRGPSHAPSAAVALGLQLSGGGRVLFVTDRFTPDEWPEEVEIVALGEPVENVAITHAARRATLDESGAEKERIDLTIANHGTSARSVHLVTKAVAGAGSAAGPGTNSPSIELDARVLELGPNARENVAFLLPPGAPLLEASIDSDALTIDDVAYLAPLPPRTLALASTLDQLTALRLGLGVPGGQGSTIARWLASVPDAIEAPDPSSAHLVLASGEPAPAPSWCLVLEQGGAEKKAWIGPFLTDRRHPLLDGVTFEGVVWSAAGGPPLPGVPIVSAGSQPLLTEDEVDGRRIFHMDLDPQGSTLQRSPDWPILLANLAEMRRSELPGPARTSLAVGESFRFRARESATYRFEGPGGAREIPAQEVLEIDGIEAPGVYTLSDASGPLCQVAYSFCDAAESDLSECSSGLREAARALARLHEGFSWIDVLLAGLALGLLLADWLVLARAHRRAGESIFASAPTAART